MSDHMPNPVSERSVSVRPVAVMMILTVRYGKNGITNCVMNYVSRFDPARISLYESEAGGVLAL